MKFPVSTTGGGKSMCMVPDVCFIITPTVPSGAPTPFPNLADHGAAEKVTEKVFVKNKPCLVEGSFIEKSKGDETGCNKSIPNGKQGIKSQSHRAKCDDFGFSGKVKMEGKGVVYHTASTKHNDENTIGKHGVPSQRVVLTAK